MTAITPIDSLDIQPVSSATSSQHKTTAYSTVASGDAVAISEEARQRFKAEQANSAMIRESQQQEETDGSTWEIGDGIKTGTFTLKNGNVQNVNIDGDTLTVEEFKDGKLVKTINGTISKNGLSLDTEYYDGSGRVRQSIHTEIAERQAGKEWTASVMTREVKWFDGGVLKGEMQDNMVLSTWNSSDVQGAETTRDLEWMLANGSEELISDIGQLARSLTVEKQHADYFARIKEYGVKSGNLAREIILEQSGRYKQASNRNYEKVGDMEPRTSRELEHKTGLNVQVREFDEDGDLVRDAHFTDNQKDKQATSDGVLEQTISVSWYNKGDLVKRSSGSMTFEETSSLGLPDRPGFLELFSMDEEEYLGSEPQSAMELMTAKSMTNGSKAGVFTEGLSRHINDHDYNPASGIGEFGEDQRPHSITWTDEIYMNGELAMRSSDSQGARETSFWQQQRGMLFRKAGGLTENEAPKALRESSHEREVYEDGRLKQSQSVTAREWVDISHDGPDQVRTTSTYTQGAPGSADTTVINGAGDIEEADGNVNAAARSLSDVLDQTLDVLQGTLKALNEGDRDDALDHRVRPVFRS